MALYTVLTCPQCGGKTNLSTDTRSATCEYCGSQLLLNAAPETLTPHSARRDDPLRPIAPRAITPRARGILVESTAEGLTIRRRWFHPRYIAMAFFCVVWDVFLLFWYGAAFNMNAPAIMFLFPLIHLAVGAVLTYTTLAGFLNTTYVDLTHSEVRIEHAPLPYPGNKRLAAADLRQLYTQEVTHRTKNGTTTTYTLNAITLSGDKLELIKDLDSPEAGLFIEQQVEQYLGISNLRVSGEVGE